MSWVLTIAGFAALIILHELGHFTAAKATGMRVERFFLFFPPKVVSVRRGETEYGIGALPFGGFVKITGMNPDEDLPPEVAPRAYYHQPVWKRIVVISAGPAMNLLVAFVLLFGLALGSASWGARSARSPRLAGRRAPRARRSDPGGGRQALPRRVHGGSARSLRAWSARTSARASRWTAAAPRSRSS